MSNSNLVLLALVLCLSSANTWASETLIDVAFLGGSPTPKKGLAATGISTNDFWNTGTPEPPGFGLISNGNLEFVDGTASGVSLQVITAGGYYAGHNGSSDPMFGVFLYAGQKMAVTLAGLSAGLYDVYLYGHGGDTNQSGAFDVATSAGDYGIEATTTNSTWTNSSWQEGVQYVEFTNVNILVGQQLDITVEPSPTSYAILSGLQIALVGPPIELPLIFTQPATQTAIPGASAIFQVTASGPPPLTYQWVFNQSTIAGATNSSFSISNPQSPNVGSYWVIVGDPYGSVTSAPAALIINSNVNANLIDVAFTSAYATSKTGFAATGQTSNDFWNTANGGSVSDLKFADGTSSGVILSVSTVQGSSGNWATDPMYGNYLFAGEITVTASNLGPGVYDIYLYGHGNQDGQNSVFQLASGWENYPSGDTTNAPGWLSTNWQQGVQYVEVTNVQVIAGQAVTVTVEPGSSAYAVLGGLQIAPVTPALASPVILAQPQSQVAPSGAFANFAVAAIGTPPLAYQWLSNNTNISGATNPAFSLSDAQLVNSGTYSVIVSNAYGSVTSAMAALTIARTNAVALIDVVFSLGSLTEKVGFAATGDTTNDFWNTCPANSTNLEFVDRTLSGAVLTIDNPSAQIAASASGAADPMLGAYLYAWIGTNSFYTFTNAAIAATISNLPAGAYDFYLYGHGNQDDYNSIFQLSVGAQTYGNSATANAPGWASPIWEEGVQYVEFTNVIVSAGQNVAITVQPGNQGLAALSGLQIASISPLISSPFVVAQPADLGLGQGSVANFSVKASGATPLTYQWLFNSSAIPGATNASYNVTNSQFANIGFYSVVVSNTDGSVTSAPAALNVAAPVSGNLIDVVFTCCSLITTMTGFAATGATTNDFWNSFSGVYAGGASLPDLRFADGTTSSVGLVAAYSDYGVASDGAYDPMYNNYIWWGGDFVITVTNLAAGDYDIYMYGHGDTDAFNTTFQLTVGSNIYSSEATTTNSNWSSPIWQQGVQYVEFSYIGVAQAQPVTITVSPDASIYWALSGMQIAPVSSSILTPFIVNQPTNQSVLQGTIATLSVGAAGTGPLAYQWLANGTNIAGATNSGYSIPNVEASNAGVYSVIITNLYGSITSAAAVLNIVATPVPTALIDVALVAKTGYAATGESSSDLWNVCSAYGSLANLKFANGSSSTAGIVISDVTGEDSNGAPDPMLNTYAYAPQSNSLMVTITNLTPGVYDFYVYGHGNYDSQNGVYQITGGSPSFGIEATTTNANWLSPIWQDGVQYTEFTNVSVSAGQPITITAEPGASGWAVFCGLQIASANTTGASPFIIAEAADQALVIGEPATLGVTAGGPLPLFYQWQLNETNIAGATNNSYSLENVLPGNAGIYSVIITNVFGSVTGTPAALNVIVPPVASVIDVAFTSTGATTKSGAAATGIAPGDFWNTCASSAPRISNLRFMDGSASGVGMAVTGVEGVGANGASDAMYGTYLYSTNGIIVVSVSNLMAGVYELYLYGHGAQDSQNSVYQLTGASQPFGAETTTNGADWLSSFWQEGVQYVEFTNVIVGPGQVLTITVTPGNSQFAVLSGLQIASFAAPPETSSPPSPIIDVAFTSKSATSKTGLAATGLSTNDFWNSAILYSGPLPDIDLYYTDRTPSSASLQVVQYAGIYGDDAYHKNGASDPMYGGYLGSLDNPIITTISNLAAGVYDFYLYGHGNQDNMNGVFQLTVGSAILGPELTTNGPGWMSPVWEEGVQYVVSSNVLIAPRETVTITADPGVSAVAVLSGLQIVSVDHATLGPLISIQPTNQAVPQGATGTFNVAAIGGGLLAYQWQFDSINIPGATNNSYSVINAEPIGAGVYSVVVANPYGSITSTQAVLNVAEPAVSLIDVAFDGASTTSKTGLAAVGRTSYDYWNTCTVVGYYTFNYFYGTGFASLTNLQFTDGTTSGAGITVSNVGGSCSSPLVDPMYANYLYTFSNQDIYVIITNLAPGVYDFYLYGHGNQDNENSIFQLSGALQTFSSQATTTNLDWLSPLWQEGVQYVEFSNVIVNLGQQIMIIVGSGANGTAELCGLQMATVNPPSNSAPLVLSTADQFVSAEQGVLVTNYAFSANSPISFSLAAGAPSGASLTTNGVFRWTPTCEQGSSTNFITVWVTDSSDPPRSNSTTFSVTVAPCVEVSIGSGVVQAGQSTCLPVSLVSSLGLTNLGFALSYPAGFLTNWNIAGNDALVAGTTAQTVDGSNAVFNVGVKSGQVLIGSNVVGQICVDTTAGASAFVPLSIANLGTATSNNTSITNVSGRSPRVVVVGYQPLLEGSIVASSNRVLTVYGDPGVSYNLLSTTNLFDKNSWIIAGSVTLTNLFQVITLGPLTNQMQFFRAVQP